MLGHTMKTDGLGCGMFGHTMKTDELGLGCGMPYGYRRYAQTSAFRSWAAYIPAYSAFEIRSSART